MKWGDIPKERVSVSVDQYTKSDLHDLSFQLEMANRNLASATITFKNIQKSISVTSIANLCGFTVLDTPLRTFHSADNPISFARSNQYYSFKDCFIEIGYSKYNNEYTFTIHYNNSAILEEIRKLVIDTVPFETKTLDSFDCTFSYFAPGEGRNVYSSTLTGHHYENIVNNYLPGVKTKIDSLLAKLKQGNNSAKLIILNGPPGSGKTHFIRSLCTEFKENFDFEFSIEPANFFANSSYFVQSLLTEDVFASQKGKIVILEDIDDLLSHNNKEKYSDIITKFLNVLDGFIGQGKNFYLVVTCNTEEQKLSKAVTRAGRCLSYIEFECFDKVSASEWLTAKGLKEEQFKDELDRVCGSSSDRLGFRTNVTQPITLSEMFRILGDCLDG